jgi:hypothetical protein
MIKQSHPRRQESSALKYQFLDEAVGSTPALHRDF